MIQKPSTKWLEHIGGTAEQTLHLDENICWNDAAVDQSTGMADDVRRRNIKERLFGEKAGWVHQETRWGVGNNTAEGRDQWISGRMQQSEVIIGQDMFHSWIFDVCRRCVKSKSKRISLDPPPSSRRSRCIAFISIYDYSDYMQVFLGWLVSTWAASDWEVDLFWTLAALFV